MEIRSYTPGTILEFVASEQFSMLKNIPISKHRALSYAHNPRAAASDKILFVAFENDEVAGYLGRAENAEFATFWPIDSRPVRCGQMQQDQTVCGIGCQRKRCLQTVAQHINKKPASVERSTQRANLPP